MINRKQNRNLAYKSVNESFFQDSVNDGSSSNRSPRIMKIKNKEFSVDEYTPSLVNTSLPEIKTKNQLNDFRRSEIKEVGRQLGLKMEAKTPKVLIFKRDTSAEKIQITDQSKLLLGYNNDPKVVSSTEMRHKRKQIIVIEN